MAKAGLSALLRILTGDLSLLDRGASAHVRAVAAFLLVLSVGTPILGVFYYVIHINLLFYVCLTTSGLGIISLLVLRKTRRFEALANFGVFLLWALLIIIRWQTGAMSTHGLELLSWVWNTVMILVAVYLTGFLWGSIWASLVFIESGFAALLYKTGHHMEAAIPQGMSAPYGLGVYLVALLVVLLIAFLFEKERRELFVRDQEQAKLIEGSRKYVESLLGKSPIPTFVIDKNHRVVQWNKACEEMTGISPQEILGKRVWKGFAIGDEGTFADELVENPEAFKEKHRDKIISQTDSGSFVLDVYLPHLKEGGRVLVNTAPITDDEGHVKGAIQCIQELTAHGKKVAGQEALLDGIADSPCPIYMVDKKGRISFWNLACERRFGHSQELMEGRSPLNLVSKRYRPAFREAVSAIFRGESFSSKEFKYYNVDGEPLYVRAELFPKRDESGKIIGCIVVNTDITDLKLRTAMLQRALMQSREKLKSLTEEYNLLKRNIASFIRKKEGNAEGANSAPEPRRP
ncbi:MAG: hypothetical protein DRG63_04105 [Deltaproteobacteria bacterium]|nr:MAG: hypothetical protein DRG63_04105 [Deltaproteobacteria bacterium]